MKTQAQYSTPMVLGSITVDIEKDLLVNSKVDDYMGDGINSVGQDYTDINLSGDNNWDEY